MRPAEASADGRPDRLVGTPGWGTLEGRNLILGLLVSIAPCEALQKVSAWAAGHPVGSWCWPGNGGTGGGWGGLEQPEHMREEMGS